MSRRLPSQVAHSFSFATLIVLFASCCWTSTSAMAQEETTSTAESPFTFHFGPSRYTPKPVAKQITIETRFVSCDRETMEGIIEKFRLPKRQRLVHSIPNLEDQIKRQLETPLAPEQGTRAEFKSETVQSGNTEWMTLSAEQVDELRELVITGQQANLLQAPTLTIRSGESGIVNDTAQRPFVIGVDTSKAETQPIIDLVREGTLMGVKAEAMPGNKINLRCCLGLSDIVRVDEAGPFQYGPGPDDFYHVQEPTLNVFSANVETVLKEGQTLLLVPDYTRQVQRRTEGWLKTKIKTEEVQYAVLIRARATAWDEANVDRASDTFQE